ncbi:MAG: FtsQ-type POTRA domain-containing protein [Clostridiales bacterium]|jgi:cell division septal protein FtsQ|nr:FtsQ-type POTRA domain-containing protein [Clostridiales bacterium]
MDIRENRRENRADKETGRNTANVGVRAAEERDRPETAANSARVRHTAGKVALVFALTALILTLLSASPLFSVSEIEVRGNLYYSENQILTKSGLRTGQNGFTALRGKNLLKLLAFRCAAAEQAISFACPYVKSVQVHYKLPNKISIAVEERSKSVVVPYFDSGLLIDEEGYVVDILKNYRSAELPVAVGLSFADYALGKKLVVADEAGIEAVLTIINALRQADRDSEDVFAWKVRSIDVRNRMNIRLTLDDGLSVDLGDGTDIYYRVSAAKEIVFHGLEPGAVGLVCFSNTAKPVFIPDAPDA